MLRSISAFLLLCLAMAIPSSALTAAPDFWQIVLAYDDRGVVVVGADPIPPMQKRVATVGLESAPGSIVYTLEWFDSKGKLLSTGLIEVPLGQRLFRGEGQACAPMIPAEDVLVLRVEGPSRSSSPARIRLTQSAMRKMAATPALPSVFAGDSFELALPPIGSNTKDGHVGSAKIRDVGPDTNRVVVVVMGDGYTAADLGTSSFTNHANDLVSAFVGVSPWDQYFNAVNVYRVDVESNQSGADGDPTQGTLRDTYLQSAFWTSGIERLLTISNTGRTRAIAAANARIGVGVWDYVFVLVNSTKYGGAGGSISVSSVHPSANLVILHEFGHTFARLADEYDDPFPGFPPGDSEPNVDFDGSGPGLKWLAWVETGTPLPTPETPEYNEAIGAFEGARYLTTGIYRPFQDCAMRFLGSRFCSVCKEAHIKVLHDSVSMIDGATPPVLSSLVIPAGGTTFTVNSLPIPTLTYQWEVGGVPLETATGPSLHLTPPMLGSGLSTLRLRISDDTELVRLHTLEESFTWLVEPGVSAVSGDWFIFY